MLTQKKPSCWGLPFRLAVWTRLELATPCVTGMYSNQTELPDRFLKTSFFLKRGCKSTNFFPINKEKNAISLPNKQHTHVLQHITIKTFSSTLYFYQSKTTSLRRSFSKNRPFRNTHFSCLWHWCKRHFQCMRNTKKADACCAGFVFFSCRTITWRWPSSAVSTWG